MRLGSKCTLLIGPRYQINIWIDNKDLCPPNRTSRQRHKKAVVSLA